MTHLALPLTEAANRLPLTLQVTIVRGARPGPRLFLTAGVHGDELEGMAIVRQVICRVDPERLAGDLVCVPLVNVPGFLARSRYLPDGSDLNRFFPGRADGKPAARLAHRLLREVVLACDCGIDFHTAARSRANLPHVRADVGRPEVRALARAFGSRVVVQRRGHPRSLRRVATEAGVPTIVFEGGETGRLRRRMTETGLRGVENALVQLGMLEAQRRRPAFRVIVRRSVWIRAERGGFAELAVAPGDLVYAGGEIGVHRDPLGPDAWPILTPVTGLVLGVSRDPVCEPGSPLCHVVRLDRTLGTVERHLQGPHAI
ncbi:MAG: succinylglutamate desuccinylase/aspartoacylase family protein [Gemmatimonadota bacterium]